jgi:hypothetical protein
MHFDLVYYSFTLFQMVTPLCKMHGIFFILNFFYFNLWKGEDPQCELGFYSTQNKKVLGKNYKLVQSHLIYLMFKKISPCFIYIKVALKEPWL